MEISNGIQKGLATHPYRALGPWRSRSEKRAVNERLRGHYNYYNIPGNLNALWRYYSWAIECPYKWLNRRGGKRKSLSWAVFIKPINRLRIAKTEMKIIHRQHRVFA